MIKKAVFNSFTFQGRLFSTSTLVREARKAVASSRSVEVTWTDGQKSSFDNFWLRDHCKCPDCWHPKTKQRLFHTFSVDQDIKPQKATADGKTVTVVWPDKHISIYPEDWLKRHSFDPKLSTDDHIVPIKKLLWNKKSFENENYPAVNYLDVMKSETGLAEWLANVQAYGFSWVRGVPVDVQATESLARRIAFIRETHYGAFWDFTSNLAHGDTAYTTLAIGGHTDSTYFTDPIGLQLFHLLEHEGEGGQTLLVDTFKAAATLREKYPKHFETLSTLKIPTHSAGDDTILVTPTPHAGYSIIQTNPRTGEVYQVRYNNHDRSVLSGKDLSKDEIRKFYDALRVWDGLVRLPENELWTKMSPGNALIVDNWRILHGRSSFTGKRRLCGAYINWDDYQSRVNMIVHKGALKNDL